MTSRFYRRADHRFSRPFQMNEVSSYYLLQTRTPNSLKKSRNHKFKHLLLTDVDLKEHSNISIGERYFPFKILSCKHFATLFSPRSQNLTGTNDHQSPHTRKHTLSGQLYVKLTNSLF